eukprot:966738-Pyramimonas_sp.AAC.1
MCIRDSLLHRPLQTSSTSFAIPFSTNLAGAGVGMQTGKRDLGGRGSGGFREQPRAPVKSLLAVTLNEEQQQMEGI